MTNQEIFDVSPGRATFNFSHVRESEKLIHWVASGGGFARPRNPDGTEFFIGKFYSDHDAAGIIEAVEEAILNGANDDEIKELCVKLDECMPIIEGVKYAMSLEMAYYLVRTHRPMDDIYFIDVHSDSGHRDTRLREFVSGRYAA
ncbi:hypothetical protein J6X09_03320 [Candidatus Saccharibacteria bacterium]|nr:hypothetical protein [Candidatus Saccharibacteria bacterium]